jgi:hypothetical protein
MVDARLAHKHSFDLAVFRGLSYRSLPLSTIKVALVTPLQKVKKGSAKRENLIQ